MGLRIGFQMQKSTTTPLLRNRLQPFTYRDLGATWRSGYAAVCKTVYPGSIPGVASSKIKHLQTDQIHLKIHVSDPSVESSLAFRRNRDPQGGWIAVGPPGLAPVAETRLKAQDFHQFRLFERVVDLAGSESHRAATRIRGAGHDTERAHRRSAST
jgi:hypothetical protein